MAEGNFPNVQQYLKQWTETIVEELRKSAIEQMNINKAKSKFPSAGDPEASSLVSGMRPEFTSFGNHIVGQIIMPASWRWFETGRSPGKMPPEAPIVKWISQRGIDVEQISQRRKGLIKSLKSKRIRKGLKQLSREKKIKQRAFQIRRKIGKEGTRATHFFSSVVTPERMNDLRQVLKEKFKKDVTITLLTEIKKEIPQ